jgi:hypothetical protein
LVTAGILDAAAVAQRALRLAYSATKRVLETETWEGSFDEPDEAV